MTTRQLAAIVRREARRLQIGHWVVEARFEPSDSMIYNGAELEGCISIEPEYQRAAMLVNRNIKSDYARVRETVVHELMHVRLEGHKPQRSRYDPAYELGLNVVAGLLVKR